MDINAVFAGLANAVDELPLQGTTLRVKAMDYLAENPPIPCFEVAEFQIRYNRTFATEAKPFGMAEVTITANLLLSRGDDESGQKEARALASSGTNTVIQAIHAARGAPGQAALGGACDDVVVRSAQGPRLADYGSAKYYVVEFSLFVIGD